MYTDETDSSAAGYWWLNRLQPLVDLLLRVVVAGTFYLPAIALVTAAELFSFGQLRLDYPLSLTPTDASVAQFESEYRFPGLSAEMLAQITTGGQLILSALVLVGLLTRIAAIGLLVMSMSLFFSHISSFSGNLQYLHGLWWVLLLMLIAHGPGKWSIDHLVAIFQR